MGVEFNVLESTDGLYPNQAPLRALEVLTQEDFSKRGTRVVDGFFDPLSPISPKNLAFLVLGLDSRHNNGFGIEGSESLMSDTIVERHEIGGMPIFYITKANVAPPYYGNGLLVKTVDKTAEVAMRQGGPSVLRTADEKVSERYARSSDIHTVIGEYAVHGFGFHQKGSRVEKFKGARRTFVETIAPYVALMQDTMEQYDASRMNPIRPIPKMDYSGEDYARLLREIEMIRKNKGLPNTGIGNSGEYALIQAPRR